MLSAHTVEQVRAAERALMATSPQGALMARAATGLAYAVLDLLGAAYGRRVLLLVGPGDNGGDALYAGALLARRGVQVEAWLLSERHHEAGLAALRAAGGRTGRPGGPGRAGAGAQPDLVLDAIVGIGGRPGLAPGVVAVLDGLAGLPVLAVDVPSGLDVDTGAAPGPHVRALATITFGTLKPVHLLDPGAQACGAVHLIDLGLDLPPADVEALQPADVAGLLPRPAPDAHKYTRGVVGVRAGSRQYPGAGLLSIAGAACGLAGMVRFVGEDVVADRVREAHPEVVGPGRVQAWVVGSGGGDGAVDALAAVLRDGVPVVVDADALAALGPSGPLPVSAVLTPHAGELAALLGVPRAEVEAQGLRHARDAARRYAATVLLKGRRTIVVGPDGPARVTISGTPWLATAGAGDVLGGLVGALLAAGLTPYDAASVGAWLHGSAAQLASRGGPITAGAVAAALPAAVRGLTAPR